MALRHATRDAHLRLEQGLGLLNPPMTGVRLIWLLSRFRSVQAAWEPAMASHPELARFAARPSRLALADADLQRLGETADAVAALPPCLGVSALAAGLPQALGVLYVMEGSTLGGQVISRAMHASGWSAAYFSPYGSSTGTYWRETQAVLRTLGPAAGSASIVTGACDMFDLLCGWFEADKPRPIAATAGRDEGGVTA